MPPTVKVKTVPVSFTVSDHRQNGNPVNCHKGVIEIDFVCPGGAYEINISVFIHPPPGIRRGGRMKTFHRSLLAQTRRFEKPWSGASENGLPC